MVLAPGPLRRTGGRWEVRKSRAVMAAASRAQRLGRRAPPGPGAAGPGLQGSSGPGSGSGSGASRPRGGDRERREGASRAGLSQSLSGEEEQAWLPRRAAAAAALGGQAGGVTGKAREGGRPGTWASSLLRKPRAAGDKPRAAAGACRAWSRPSREPSGGSVTHGGGQLGWAAGPGQPESAMNQQKRGVGISPSGRSLQLLLSSVAI